MKEETKRRGEGERARQRLEPAGRLPPSVGARTRVREGTLGLERATTLDAVGARASATRGKRAAKSEHASVSVGYRGARENRKRERYAITSGQRVEVPHGESKSNHRRGLASE